MGGGDSLTSPAVPVCFVPSVHCVSGMSSSSAAMRRSGVSRSGATAVRSCLSVSLHLPCCAVLRGEHDAASNGARGVANVRQGGSVAATTSRAGRPRSVLRQRRRTVRS
jgi:hypothetical protein